MSNLSNLFSPNSIAIIGASGKKGKIGNAVVTNMIDSGFKQKIYPINPKESEIEGLKAYKSVSEIEEQVDAAVLSIPAKHCPKAAEECGKNGVKHLIVISSGFKEVGQEGKDLEEDLVRICHEYGMRLVGPNCVGMMDTHAGINASFSSVYPPKGDITFISQSGAMLVAILDWSKLIGLGYSKIVSLGNKADLTEANFIESAADDPNTNVILCYLEDVADGEYFLEAASRASSKKPVIILKSGTSQAGAQAASSHTGALAGSDRAYTTAFNQSGVIRAYSMPQLFDLATAFSRQPVPKSGRVAVVTNAGGPGIVATDTIENEGLTMSKFSQETLKQLEEYLPGEANIYNPIDVMGDAKADRYAFSLEKALADDNTDSALVLVCPTAVTEPVETAQKIIDIHKKYPEKPVLTAYMGGEILKEGADLLEKEGIPCFTFPETAIHAFKGMSIYNTLKQRVTETTVEPGLPVDKKKVETIFKEVKKDGRQVLLGSETYRVAEAYQISAAPIELAANPDDAVTMAEKMGYPLVLKIASEEIIHKSDVGGVKIKLANAQEVREGFQEINDNVKKHAPEANIHGIEVQKMMPEGRELLIGMSKDPQFGPLLAFGLGGIYVNLLKDVSFRLTHNLTKTDIENMIKETKAHTLLHGYRGEEPADIETLISIIKQVSILVTDFPQISELDINPVFAYTDGASALDIKITLS
ncbi:MAG: acetate--CoA ligase family protein [Clostridiales bacterium]|nr:acetate--CoA ligase family protein [Clostridiales bacterium]MCF8022584.1 acetate--CoA ligase family protein [Clostridiales bacterium]